MEHIKAITYQGRTYFNVPVNGLIECEKTKTDIVAPIPLPVLRDAFIKQQWQEVKDKRQKLLNASDWTQAVDAPLSESQKAAWQTYRQALRDLPEKFESPESVVWPEAPNA